MQLWRVGLLTSAAIGVLVSSCGTTKGTPALRCAPGTIKEGNACVVVNDIRLNSVGYLPSRQKQASWIGSESQFQIRSADDDRVIFEGRAESRSSEQTGEPQVWVGDFTELREEGGYYVQAGELRSPEFPIGANETETALSVTMLGIYGQRCGSAVDITHNDQRFRHAACHLEDASLEYSETEETGTKNDHGGWHDAGDYGKYAVNGAFAVAVLLKAYEHHPEYVERLTLEIPERDNQVPDLLDEARIELEWLLKVQYENGSVAHKVTALGFSPDNTVPSKDTSPRFFSPASSTATADTVATFALASRLFQGIDQDFADELLNAALKGSAWLAANPDPLTFTNGVFNTGAYGDSNDGDERLWALAELWETTGDAAYLDGLESGIASTDVAPNFDWASVANLALATYLESAQDGRNQELVEEVKNKFLAQAEFIVEESKSDAYGHGLRMYYWGINGIIARASFVLGVAHRQFPDQRYLDAASEQLAHLFGRNTFGRSYLTGVGVRPAEAPHHRPSVGDSIGTPWPGLLVGGPNGQEVQGLPEDLTRAMSGLPEGARWVDDARNWLHNEVAINWSTALAYNLIFTLATKDDSNAECAPDCFRAITPPPETGTGGTSSDATNPMGGLGPRE
ncbi:MAG: glycoside hydrolase family 9 protein [Polyangiaceae bacterium]|nr:glycoside hydrolase family 9 protein [Polyangiaceae bacterium]